jgi:hypothetical protein
MGEPNFGCKVVFDEPFGKSHCEVCGRQWEPMTPKGSENHCVRELGSRLAHAIAERDTAREMLRDGRKWMQHTDIGCIESVPDMCVCGLDQFLASLKE